MERILIAAIAENGVIGYRNQLPWHIPEDLRHFRKLTLGYPVVMGRQTSQSIGRFLQDRINIVLTRDRKFSPPDKRVLVCHSIEEAIAKAEDFSEFVTDWKPMAKNDEDYSPKIFFAGGADVYRQAIDIVDKMEWTRIYMAYRGDAFFPEVNLNAWEEVGRQDFPRSDNLPAFSFLSYRKL